MYGEINKTIYVAIIQYYKHLFKTLYASISRWNVFRSSLLPREFDAVLHIEVNTDGIILLGE